MLPFKKGTAILSLDSASTVIAIRALFAETHVSPRVVATLWHMA